jgi:hypothetical protein
MAATRRDWAPVVALVAPGAEQQLCRIVRALDVDIDYVSGVDQLVTRVETKCPRTIVVDADVLGWPASLVTLARSLRTDVFVVALLHHWSEREETLRQWVDAVLHKPPRLEEWMSLFGARSLRFAGGGARAVDPFQPFAALPSARGASHPATPR